jgi:hypothetical protein
MQSLGRRRVLAAALVSSLDSPIEVAVRGAVLPPFLDDLGRDTAAMIIKRPDLIDEILIGGVAMKARYRSGLLQLIFEELSTPCPLGSQKPHNMRYSIWLG